jgi:ABC-type spermidine/putrescine transport system permease subunit II
MSLLSIRPKLTERERRQFLLGLLFASPWIIGFLAFTIIPIAASFYYSFTRYDLLRPPHFIGLSNYTNLFLTDPNFRIVAYNTLLGVSQIPRELHRAAQSLGTRRLRMFWEVLLPGSLPGIVTGMRVGMGYGWRGLIAAEIIAGTAGLGYSLFLAEKFFHTHIIVLMMVLIGLVWVLMDRLLLAPLERRTVERWGMKQVSG